MPTNCLEGIPARNLSNHLPKAKSLGVSHWNLNRNRVLWSDKTDLFDFVHSR